jgi:hypothetical protein
MAGHVVGTEKLKNTELENPKKASNLGNLGLD